MQESFYSPSVAARQLLSLSPVCKEMRRLVLDTGLPAIAQQVRVNEHPMLLYGLKNSQVTKIRSPMEDSLTYQWCNVV